MTTPDFFNSTPAFTGLDTSAVPPLQWNNTAEAVLLRTLYEQVDRGKRSENGFKKKAWTAACQAIQAELGLVVLIA